MTVEQARELAKIQLGKVASGEDPAEVSRRVRKDLNVAEMCEWYLVEARAGRILGRKNRPIKDTSLNMDESRIRTHIIPMMGKRLVRKPTNHAVTARSQEGRQGGKEGVRK